MKNILFKISCIAIICAIIINLNSSFNKIVSVSLSFENKETILLDLGHGGEDSGAIGLDGEYEKNINLSIGLMLKTILNENGYKVILTRTIDEDLADKTLGSVSERKKSDMNKRLDIINNSGADFAISIHQNFFEQHQYKGLQVFYAKENSKNLAEIIQSTVVENLQTDNNRLAKYVDNKFLLNNSTIPMVIVECGFISNREDLKILTDENEQLKIVNQLYNAIDKYCEKQRN